jgi:hypothetical protein
MRLTTAQRPAIIMRMKEKAMTAAEMARKRWSKVSSEARAEYARMMVRAREEKRRKEKLSPLSVGKSIIKPSCA